MSRTRNEPSDEIRDLIVEAGPPDPIPDDDLAALRDAARGALARRSGAPIFEGRSVSPILEGRTYRRALALAATLALAAVAVWLFTSTGRPASDGAPVATVELVRGDAATLVAGTEIAAGARIDTGSDAPVRVALRMAGGHSVRVDADSALRVVSATRLELERGGLYVDSGPLGASRGLEIGTPLGVVREIGTQYEVRVRGNGDASLRVRVREGQVAVSRDGTSHSASRGEQLTIDDSGTVVRRPTPSTGGAWAWVSDVAPLFDTDGKTLAEYLDWLSRETGLEVEFESPSLELDATQVMVVGSPDGLLTPEQTLDVILPSFGLSYRIQGGRLIVTGPASAS